jgi:nucleotide-binding universal stress UspA family protein
VATKLIVSYDGTENDQDALALGGVLADAGASIVLAYVRHLRETGERERLAEHEAEELLRAGAASLGRPDVPQFVVLSASTPEGLAELAATEGANAIVFGSAYRTTPGHVFPQASAERLLDGGRTAVAIAPAGYRPGPIRRIAALDGDEDESASATAAAFAARLGAEVVARPNGGQDLLVVGSKLGTPPGQVRVSAAAAYVIELIRCPVLVLPRGVPLSL